MDVIPTPETDAEEVRQRAEYEDQRETGWPAFPADFDFARQLERERDEWKAKAERTCKWIPDGCFYESECGSQFFNRGHPLDYCSHCGGRIVKE